MGLYRENNDHIIATMLQELNAQEVTSVNSLPKALRALDNILHLCKEHFIFKLLQQ